MTRRRSDHGLEFLLAFDGRIHHLEKGYWLKFEMTRGEATRNRPHGLSYSFTLRAPDGTRLVGFDNAHGIITEVEMKHAKVQNLRALRDEMKAVARGERPAPADAGKPSFNSVE